MFILIVLIIKTKVMEALDNLKKTYKEMDRNEKQKIQGGTQQKSVVIWSRMAITEECTDHILGC